MLDVKLIREKPEFVRERLAARGAGDEARIDDLLKLDEQRRKLLAEVEGLKASWTNRRPQPRRRGMK